MCTIFPLFYRAFAGRERILAILSMLTEGTWPKKLEALAAHDAAVGVGMEHASKHSVLEETKHGVGSEVA